MRENKIIPILFNNPMIRAILSGQKITTRRILNPQPSTDGLICRNYEVGDILWVREAYGKTPTGFAYMSDSIMRYEGNIRWISPLLMPKTACRLFLKVVDVRLERIQDITEDEAYREGVGREGKFRFKNYRRSRDAYEYLSIKTAKDSFQTLWESIYGENSWNVNPYVWVVEFERVERPENFI